MIAAWHDCRAEDGAGRKAAEQADGDRAASGAAGALLEKVARQITAAAAMGFEAIFADLSFNPCARGGTARRLLQNFGRRLDHQRHCDAYVVSSRPAPSPMVGGRSKPITVNLTKA